MTTPPTTTAVAKRPDLSPEMQREVESRRLHSAMVQKIRGATWGNTFDANTIAAVAAWARENDVDPVTEIDVLGGNLYIKAAWYERKLSHLIAAGQIEYARKDWVHVDKRLEKLADAGDEAAKLESRRRLNERIKYNLSDAADAACVYRIKHRLMTEEVTGAKEHVPGKRKDPVGDAMPMETVETRAIRRAMLQLKDALRDDVRIVSTNDDAAVEVAAIVKENHTELKRDREVKQITAPTTTYEPEATDPAADLAFDAELVRQESEGDGLFPEEPTPRRVAQREGR